MPVKIVETTLGSLYGVEDAEYYTEGSLKQCRLIEPNSLHTPSGLLTAQYRAEHVRKKYSKSLTLHQNGAIKALRLERQSLVPTPLGEIPAEFLTWYTSGALKRVFPLNGKLSAYWSEEEEATLAYRIALNLPVGNIAARIVGLHFYACGALKSLTLWPGENILLQNPLGGLLSCRIGFSLYEDGGLKSCEPAQPVRLSTPIGAMWAFDSAAIGVHADSNSLCFRPGGKLWSLASACVLKVETKTGRKFAISPLVQRNPLEDDGSPVIIPLRCIFEGRELQVENAGKNIALDLKEDSVSVHPFVYLPALVH
jgi:hypothetical protein